MKKVIFILLVLVTVLLSISQDILTTKLINYSSWTLSYLIPKILILFISLVVGFLSYKMIRRFKILFALLFSITLLTFSFYKSPIYQGDLNSEGIHISFDKYKNNKTIISINENFPNFDGLIAIASSSCPHCKVAAKKLSILKNRQPNRDVLFVIFSLDSSKIDAFIQETGASNLTYILAPDEKGTLELCQGRFPTFFYLKNNNIIHKWNNDDIGYPAYDWIENGLN